jgi:hypothetical protein
MKNQILSYFLTPIPITYIELNTIYFVMMCISFIIGYNCKERNNLINSLIVFSLVWWSDAIIYIAQILLKNSGIFV